MNNNMFKKVLFIFILATLLSGCIPAAFIAGATAGGALIYDHRNLSTIVADRNITYRAAKAIASDPALAENAHISVATLNGIVLIIGQAPTDALREQAQNLVEQVPNIRRIYDRVTIEKPTSAFIRSKDAWITTKTKSMMLAAKGLHSSQVKVITENGVIYLMGLVSRPQSDLAANVARRVSGVKKVVKLFEYK